MSLALDLALAVLRLPDTPTVEELNIVKDLAQTTIKAGETPHLPMRGQYPGYVPPQALPQSNVVDEG